MKSVFLACLIGAGMTYFGLNAAALRPIANPPFRQSGIDAHDGSASASLLGQFRTNISAWLWVRTDLYMHNGVQMRPITPAEQKAGVGPEKAVKDGNEPLRRETAVTLVPSPDRDFRGILGEVDRSVNAWQDMHNHSHNDPKQTLALFRLMTWLDPQFIEAWTTGAMVFARDRNRQGTQNALRFLNEGLAENQDSIDLLTEVAYVHLTREKDLSAAIPFLEKARRIGSAHVETLADNEKDALENAYRWLAMCYRDTHQPKMAARTAAEGLVHFSDDGVLKRLLANADKAIEGTASEAEATRAGGD